MYTLVGLERKIGEGTDRQTGKEFGWDNYVFYLMEKEKGDSFDLKANGDLRGQRVLVEKVKASSFVDDLPDVGSDVEVYYNKYGKATRIIDF